MISFPAIWLLYAFDLIGGLLIVLSLFYIANAVRHGSHMGLTMISNTIFLAGIAVIAFVSWTALSHIDWTQNFTLSLLSFTLIGLVK